MTGRPDDERPTHVPVLERRTLELLLPALQGPAPVVVDGTLGLGGHAYALLSGVPELRLVGMDRDEQALELAGARLSGFGDRVSLVHATYDRMPDALADLVTAGWLETPAVQGVLLDLGVSSMQLDRAERGFAYARDVPLDMRMDPSRGPTAADVLATYDAHELARVLREYGEERHAHRIAEAIVRERGRRAFETSAQLVALIHEVLPAAAQRSGHPAKRTFQALRIEVNGELVGLERVLPAAVDALAVGGRIAVMAYHSLEDRIVKRALAALSRPDVPEGAPGVPAGHEPVLRPLTRGAEQASDAEIAANPRASSVRLRAAERVSTGSATARAEYGARTSRNQRAARHARTRAGRSR